MSEAKELMKRKTQIERKKFFNENFDASDGYAA